MRKYIILALTVLMVLSFAGVSMAATTALHIANPHQSFTANTAACASCHTTHNASGPKLLSGSNTYATCTNCHDGTESVYDVKLGQIGTTGAAVTYDDSNAGLFEGTSLSRHAANGGTGIDPVTTANLNSMGLYDHTLYGGTNVFSCASCHDPHKKLSDVSEAGTAFNSRLLKAAPRMIQKTDPKFTFTNDGVSAVTIGTTATGSILNLSTGIYNTAPLKPVLYEVTAGPTYTQVTYTAFDSATKKFTGITGYGVAKVYVADFYVKAPQVVISYGANYRTTTPTASGPETPSYPVAINAWCGTCHNDYFLSSDAKIASGDYNNTKYRHGVGISDKGWVAAGKTATFAPKVNTVPATIANVNMPLASTGEIICLTCHFAHGTKATSTITNDAVTITKDAAFGGGTVANVSKLLRYDNRDTCEFCHQK